MGRKYLRRMTIYELQYISKKKLHVLRKKYTFYSIDRQVLFQKSNLSHFIQYRNPVLYFNSSNR